MSFRTWLQESYTLTSAIFCWLCRPTLRHSGSVWITGGCSEDWLPMYALRPPMMHTPHTCLLSRHPKVESKHQCEVQNFIISVGSRDG